jgi:hypothetical protein
MSYFKNITHRDYNHYKAKYNNTVPIRGRGEDVRPIGERRRTHELITQKPLLSGEVSYCATLYGTDAVEYHNNGQVTLRAKGWQTPTTAEFMHEHSPFTVWKQDNKLWVRVSTPDGMKAFPVGEELTLRMVDGANGAQYYEPINKVLINKRVVDRAKAKAAREPLQPFLAWCKSFLAMSDGWVMHETRKAVLGWEKRESRNDWVMPLNNIGDEELYRTLTEQMEIVPEDKYLLALCRMSSNLWVEKRQVETHQYERVWAGQTHMFTQNFDEYRVEFDNFKRKVYSLSERFGDIHTILQVEPTNKAIGNTV